MKKIDRILFKYELIKIFRQPLVIGFGILFPIIWTFFNGEIFENVPSESFGGIGSVDYVFPSFIFMVIIVNGFTNISLTVAKNKELSVYKNYFGLGIKEKTIYISLMASNLILVLSQFIILVVINKVMYDVYIPSFDTIIFMVLLLFLQAISIAGVGIFIAAITKTYQSSLALSLGLYFVILFTSGASTPVVLLPESIYKMTNFMPYKYFIDLLRNVWLEIPISSLDVIVNIIFIGLGVYLGYLGIRKIKKQSI